MTFWQFLKSIWLYFFFSTDDLYTKTLVCPAVETIDKHPEHKELGDYFNAIMAKKQNKEILHVLDGQDVFQKTSDSNVMIYTNLVPKENIEYDLKAMRTHKYLAKMQNREHKMVTDFLSTKCVLLDQQYYFFMNEESMVDGAMPGIFERDQRMFRDFENLAFRLDFYNRILDKLNEVVYAGYKFTKLLKGQVLFKIQKVDANPPRVYDPIFDIYYWTEKSKVEPTEETPNPPQDRFDLLLTVLLILDIEFDYFHFKMKRFANQKTLLLQPEVVEEAKFPDSVPQMDKTGKGNVSELIMFTSSAFDMSISLNDSPKEIQIVRDLLEYFKRVLLILNKETGLTELQYKTYSEFLGGLVTACLNDQNILAAPALDSLVDFNLNLLLKLVQHQEVKDKII